MTSTKTRYLLATMLCSAWLAARAAGAQPAPPPAPPAPPAPAEAPPAPGAVSRALEEARERLEAAAEEVARLSAEVAAPQVSGIVRQFAGSGRRAVLGLMIEDAEDGVRVTGVSPGGPAADAGIEVGDIVTAIDDAALKGSGDSTPTRLLIAQMRNVDPGGTVKLKIMRDGKEREIAVEPRPVGPHVLAFAPNAPGPVWFGEGGHRFAAPGRWRQMELVELTPTLGSYFGTDHGILVVRAPPDEALKLRDGDVILEIAGRTPSNPEHVMRILSGYDPGEKLELTLMRERRRVTLDIEIPGAEQQG